MVKKQERLSQWTNAVYEAAEQEGIEVRGYVLHPKGREAVPVAAVMREALSDLIYPSVSLRTALWVEREKPSDIVRGREQIYASPVVSASMVKPGDSARDIVTPRYSINDANGRVTRTWGEEETSMFLPVPRGYQRWSGAIKGNPLPNYQTHLIVACWPGEDQPINPRQVLRDAVDLDELLRSSITLGDDRQVDRRHGKLAQGWTKPQVERAVRVY